MGKTPTGISKHTTKSHGRPAGRREKDKDPSQPKDLIRIRNQLNGKVYKFACGTCISGHRAPHCNPKKHFDKILFRRPEPGRPPRDCGHPKIPPCDCKASRELCCHLTKPQWAELQSGGVPTAVMYRDQKELEGAMRDADVEVRQEVNMYAYPSSAIPYRPPPPPPPPNMHFGYPGSMAQYNQYAPYPPQPTQQLGPFGYQPAPTIFEQPGYQPQFHPAEARPHDQNMSMSMNMQSLQQFAMDMGQQEQMAAQPSANPSQSCCSRKQAQPPLQPYMGATTSAFNLPGPAPRAQFPCQSCASFQCTCVTCPEVRQVSSGAWSQSCGRGGHIDNMVVPKQEYTLFQESQSTLQGYNGLQDASQDYSHMLSEQHPVQQSTLEASQLSTAEQFVQTQSAFGSMPVDFSMITDEEIQQAWNGLHDTTQMGASGVMPVDFSNNMPMTSEPMPFQQPSQVNGAEHLPLPAHIQQEISTTYRVQEVSASPEASADYTVDPRNLRIRPQEQ